MPDVPFPIDTFGPPLLASGEKKLSLILFHFEENPSFKCTLFKDSSVVVPFSISGLSISKIAVSITTTSENKNFVTAFSCKLNEPSKSKCKKFENTFQSIITVKVLINNFDQLTRTTLIKHSSIRITWNTNYLYYALIIDRDKQIRNEKRTRCITELSVCIIPFIIERNKIIKYLFLGELDFREFEM